MQKTANYQLNQWEENDRILRTEFNEDNSKMDGAIKAVDNRVSAEATARQNAVSAEAAARAAADNAEIAARTAAVQAARDACPVVLLRSVTTTAAVNQIDLSLSGIDWNAYGDILVYMCLKLKSGSGVFGYVTVLINNNTGFVYTGSNGTTQKLISLTADISGIDFCCRIPRGQSGLGTIWSGFTHMADFPYFAGQTASFRGNRDDRNLYTSMNFICEKPFDAGCKFTILGVRA